MERLIRYWYNAVQFLFIVPLYFLCCCVFCGKAGKFIVKNILLRYLLAVLALLIGLPAFACVLFFAVLIFMAGWLWHRANRLRGVWGYE